MHQITLTSMPLPLFKTMAQSRRGAPHILEAQVPVLFLASFAVTVYRVGAFTSVGVPLIVQVALSILKKEVRVRPLVVAILRFIQLSLPFIYYIFIGI
jgi:hypothetical protein